MRNFGSPLCVCVCAQSYVTLVTPWIVAHQVPLSIEFSRQEYWSGLPCSPPRDIPDSGLKPASLVSPALAGRFFYHCTIQEAFPIGSSDIKPPFKNKFKFREFPGNPVVRTPCFHGQGHKFTPSVGVLRSCKSHGK